MPYVERTDEEIIAGYERELANNPEPDKPIMYVGRKTYSNRQFVEALRARDPQVFHVLVTLLREDAREHDEDPLEDFPTPSE